MTVHCRLVDSEGVTWDEFDTECYHPYLRVPIPPRRTPVEYSGGMPEPLPTVEFHYERTDGGGVRIYRLTAL